MTNLNFLVLVMLVLIKTVSTAHNNTILQVSLSKPMAKLLAHIVVQFYAKETNCVSITRAADNNVSLVRQSGIVEEFLSEIGEEILVNLETEDIEHHSHSKRFYNIFFIDSYDSFRKIVNPETLDSFDFTGYYTIIVSKFEQNYTDIVERILQDCWKLYIVNVNVLTYDTDLNEALVHTYFPYTANFCGKVRPITYAEYSEKSILPEKDLFPDKFSNFYGCRITMGSLHFPPYMILRPTGFGAIKYFGFEGVLITNLAKKLNFSITLKTSNEEWGKLDDENSTGLSRMLYFGEVNFTIGCFGYSLAHQESLSNTVFYYATPLTMLIPPGRAITGAEKLFLPFTTSTWISLEISFILAATFVVIGKYLTPRRRAFIFGPQNHYPFINIINIYFGGTMANPPRRNFARFLIMLWILTSFVLRSSYQAILFDFMREPRYSSPKDTLQKMYEAGFKIFGDDGLEVFVESIPKYGSMYTLIDGNEYTEYRSKSLDHNFKGAVMVTGLSAKYLNGKYGSKDTYYHVSKQPITEYYVSILLRKHSYLKEPFDREIWRYKESGLIDHWANAALFYNTKKWKTQDSPKSLTLTELRGIFVHTWFFLGIGLLVLLLEVLSRKFLLVRRLCDFLN